MFLEWHQYHTILFRGSGSRTHLDPCIPLQSSVPCAQSKRIYTSLTKVCTLREGTKYTLLDRRGRKGSILPYNASLGRYERRNLHNSKQMWTEYKRLAYPCTGTASRVHRHLSSLSPVSLLAVRSATQDKYMPEICLREVGPYLSQREPLPFRIIHEIDTRNTVWQDVYNSHGNQFTI